MSRPPGASSRPDISVVVPTYNEAERLRRLAPELIEAFRSAGRPRFELIIVDDNSPDGTGAVADQLAAAHPGLIRVVQRPGMAGLGTAVVAGWQVAHAPILAVIDADGQHAPGALIELLQWVEQGADVAVASRSVPGGQTRGWNPLRLAGSRLCILLTRALLPGVARLRDPLSTCFVVRREVIAGKDLQPLGQEILLEVLARGDARKVVEVPLAFTPSQAVRSKAGLQELAAFLVHLLHLAWGTRHLARMARYLLVGVSGVVVNLGVLAALRELTSLPLSYCGALAVSSALLSNFSLHEFWTFADWSPHTPGWRARLHRLAKFAAISAGGALANWAILLLLARVIGLHYLLAGAVGVVVAALWNYGMNANLTWKSPQLLSQDSDRPKMVS